jgi:hypothetical protein
MNHKENSMGLILVPFMVLRGIIPTLFSLTGGGTFVTLAFCLDAYQRRNGYKPGEGVSTQRYPRFEGMTIDGDNAVEKTLSMVEELWPGTLSAFKGRRFLFTLSEGELLKAMLIPVVEAIASGDEQLVECTLQPVIMYLERFPKGRVKEWQEQS